MLGLSLKYQGEPEFAYSANGLFADGKACYPFPPDPGTFDGSLMRASEL